MGSGGFGDLLGGFGGGFGSVGWFRVVSGGFGSFHLLVSTLFLVLLFVNETFDCFFTTISSGISIANWLLLSGATSK